MKIVLSWLKDYVDINLPAEKIVDALLMAGIEVESFYNPAKSLRNVVIGEIISCNKHPNADKLNICKVKISEEKILNILCGANNCSAGAKVPVALPGAQLPSGITIQKAIIRGIESDGMICSKKELGLGDEHEGIYILPSNAPIGEEISKYLELDDVIFEISITPNRGDLLSHLGIARELSAIFNIPLLRNELDNDAGECDIAEFINVEIEDKSSCLRYGARVIKDVMVGPSPDWIKRRLEKAGIRSINNVVDVTNYVMLDIGHPMHAFDYDKIENKKIIVRKAKNNEEILCLDGVKRRLDDSMLVIADDIRPIALAGIIGGEETSVTLETKNVLLEAAVFDPIIVRKTAKLLGVATESSYRFERGVNVENVPIALNLASRLIKDTSLGKPIKRIFDVYPSPVVLPKIFLRINKVNKLLGIQLKPSQIETFLLRLKFNVKSDKDGFWVEVPPFRHDIKLEIDLVEEIARILGYNKIPNKLPEISSKPVLPTNLQKIREIVKQNLIDYGFNEIITYSFIPANIPEAFKETKSIKIVNPLSEEHSELRTTLLWNVYSTLVKNIFLDEEDLKFFEIGKVFQTNSYGYTQEFERLCIGCCGVANVNDWKHSRERFDIYLVRGILDRIAKLVNIEFIYKPGLHKAFHPKKQLDIYVYQENAGLSKVGIVGQLHPCFREHKKIPEEIYLAEIDLTILSQLKPKIKHYNAITEFPPIKRDLALLIPKSIHYSEVEKIISQVAGNLLERAQLFDVYEGKNIPFNMRSVAVSLTFRAKDRTLKSEEIDVIINKIIDESKNKLQASLRS